MSNQINGAADIQLDEIVPAEDSIEEVVIADTPATPATPASSSTGASPRRDDLMDEERCLDEILIRIGQFGRYQIMIFALLCIPMIFNSFFSISYVFTASTVVHRCNITQCDTPTTGYEEPWLNFTIPKKKLEWDQCTRYKANVGAFNKRLKIPQGEFCSADKFNQSHVEECGTDFKFRDDEYTISNEFGIFCHEDWKLSMVGTINNIGQFVGIAWGGFIADRYGRRFTLAISGTLAALMGIIRSFSTDYYMFLSLEFLDNAVGSTLFPTSFLMAIELVGPKKRVAAATIITICYGLGEAFLGFLAMTFPNWRDLLRVLYAPGLLQIALLWLLPESVRWLMSQGREEKAARILKKAARFNGRHVRDAELTRMVATNHLKLVEANEGQYPLRKALKLFSLRILNCCLCWFTHTLIGLGLSISSVSLGGNKYKNFMYNGLIQIPGLLLPLLIMDRFGRRLSLFACMMVCSVCIAITIFVPADNYTVSLILFLISKLAITCSFQILYFFTSEIFPTKVRNSLLSFCSMLGRFGSMVAPQTPLLAKYFEPGPQILFATFACMSGFSALLFPETTDKLLPTTLVEARELTAVVPERRHSSRRRM